MLNGTFLGTIYVGHGIKILTDNARKHKMKKEAEYELCLVIVLGLKA